MASDKMIIDESKYEAKIPVRYVFKTEPGLTERTIREISSEKNEPDWMLKRRLKSFEIFKSKPMPTWGPDLSELDFDKITFYIKPEERKASSWEELPQDIRETFDRLGIPEYERRFLGGSGAMYESEVVYSKLKKELREMGVIFTDTDTAVKEYPELVKEYFMTECVPPSDNKFAALHGAVWSGGSFIYVPPHVKVPVPLQIYFVMAQEAEGQFEHTIIIAEEGSEVNYIEGCSAPRYSKSSLHSGVVEIFTKKNARVRYTSIQNWSKSIYNLNTKRALVDENGVVEWISGTMGSKVTMLYPGSVLRGKGARAEHLTIGFAGKGQYKEGGAKIMISAPYTSAKVIAKSICANGGVMGYRGLVKINKGAVGSKVNVRCDALLMDSSSKSFTIPYNEINESKEVIVSHEAFAGKIDENHLFYLMSRGLNEEEAKALIVRGFIEPIMKKLPFEYAVELNRLIELEISKLPGAVG
jgi:Fe-S cluster assembly protein SufB